MGLRNHPGLPPLALLAGGVQGSPFQNLTPATSTLATAGLTLYFAGYVCTEDGLSHTIDNTGASSIGFRLGALTWANAGSVLNVGIAGLSTTDPPARPANSGTAITFDVSRQLTGGAGLTANAWNELAFNTGSVSGSKTIAHGDFVCVAFNLSARGGTDSVLFNYGVSGGTVLPGTPMAGTWNGTTQTTLINVAARGVVITFADGKIGWLFGSNPFNTESVTSGLNSSASPNEVGNLFRVPTLMRVRGFSVALGTTVSTADFDLCIYSNPLGSPVLEASRSVDVNFLGSLSTAVDGGVVYVPLVVPALLEPKKTYAVTVKPTTTGNVNVRLVTVGLAAYQKIWPAGDGGYAVDRTGSGAFASRSSDTQRFCLGLSASALHDGIRPQYHLGAFF